jgi:SOS response regulatory protein OraA/RecX
VRHLRREGRTEAEIRARLKEEGYKPGRISQLLKLTRVEEIQEAGQGG